MRKMIVLYCNKRTTVQLQIIWLHLIRFCTAVYCSMRCMYICVILYFDWTHSLITKYLTLIQEPTLYTVKGMAILDNDGNRILAKYYDKNVFPTSKEQKTFEKNLFSKTHRANAEIIMLDGLTCVYRSNVDLFFYVMGSSQENEVFTNICWIFWNYYALFNIY